MKAYLEVVKFLGDIITESPQEEESCGENCGPECDELP